MVQEGESKAPIPRTKVEWDVPELLNEGLLISPNTLVFRECINVPSWKEVVK